MYQQQTAKMRMTPQLRQAIKILQLPAPELLEHIRRELEDNPVLEAPETGWWHESRGDADFDPLQHAVRSEQSLERHLEEQLSFVKRISLTLRRIVRYMIGNVDRNGYLEPSLEEIAETLRSHPDHVNEALSVLQSFDPAGVGARNLQECLHLQALRLPHCPALVPRLIAHHLEDIACFRIQKLADRLNAPLQDIRDAIEVIKGLNPRPGAAYSSGDNNPYIIPDVTIEKEREQFLITVHETSSPRLSINSHYEQMAKGYGTHPETRSFLYPKWRSAVFLIKCIEQRRLTLFRVTQAIVEEQADFFRNGPSHLKPMNLKHIADKMNLHESTVSRATAGKYALTPWGVFELSDFFPSGLQNGTGDSVSVESVKETIKERIRRENSGKPYSDQQLAQLLTEEGIRISRRTVAKYREELGIASSVRRRRS
jgi:RNA polymerase sigma-54 factor